MKRTKLNEAEKKLIEKITKRFRGGSNIPPKTIERLLATCHTQACRLDLKQLLKFDTFNFCHDLYGLSATLVPGEGRKNASLKNHFRPRCAQR